MISTYFVISLYFIINSFSWIERRWYIKTSCPYFGIWFLFSNCVILAIVGQVVSQHPEMKMLANRPLRFFCGEDIDFLIAAAFGCWLTPFFCSSFFFLFFSDGSSSSRRWTKSLQQKRQRGQCKKSWSIFCTCILVSPLWSSVGWMMSSFWVEGYWWWRLLCQFMPLSWNPTMLAKYVLCLFCFSGLLFRFFFLLSLSDVFIIWSALFLGHVLHF